MIQLSINKSKTTDINSSMFGVCIEDINYAIDGGLHNEFIENGSFEFLQAKGKRKEYFTCSAYDYGWEKFPKSAGGAIISIESEDSISKVNSHFLRFKASENQRGFTNKAYDGIILNDGDKYKLSFYARSISFFGHIIISIIKHETQIVLAKTTIDDVWTKYEFDIISNTSIKGGYFLIQLSNPGVVDFDFISLIPQNSIFGIFRKDILDLLIALKPGFVRFPGGCVVEGNTLENRYQWKKSIGNKLDRKFNWNRWAVSGNKEENDYTSKFSHYNQSLGIGFYEYFLLCEFLKAKPIPVINVGLACQYHSDEIVGINTTQFMDYIQDALDLIEFANGREDTKYGAIRAGMGHIEPFSLEVICLGNEQWQTEIVDFYERYIAFEDAIHKKFPEIKIIGTAGPDIGSENHKKAWKFFEKENIANKQFSYAIDEHIYATPEWFLSNTKYYDNYQRGIKVFLGEYASHPKNLTIQNQTNNLETALSEASFLTGLQRNSDVIEYVSYAPLFARFGYTQWAPSLIWFNDETAYCTPNYYIQKLFSEYLGNYNIKASLIIGEKNIEKKSNLFHYAVSYNIELEEIYIKLVNASTDNLVINIILENFRINRHIKYFKVSGNAYDDYNMFDKISITPKENYCIMKSEQKFEVDKLSFYVLILKTK